MNGQGNALLLRAGATSLGLVAVAGQSYQVDMLSPQVFSEVTLDAGTTSSNFPRAYQVVGAVMGRRASERLV